ncbi:MAG: hypothetical protein AVDCRST_MAG93-4845, partial [uncultured Chloroflexia bacterium]
GRSTGSIRNQDPNARRLPRRAHRRLVRHTQRSPRCDHGDRNSPRQRGEERPRRAHRRVHGGQELRPAQGDRRRRPIAKRELPGRPRKARPRQAPPRTREQRDQPAPRPGGARQGREALPVL